MFCGYLSTPGHNQCPGHQHIQKEREKACRQVKGPDKILKRMVKQSIVRPIYTKSITHHTRTHSESPISKNLTDVTKNKVDY